MFLSDARQLALLHTLLCLCRQRRPLPGRALTGLTCSGNLPGCALNATTVVPMAVSCCNSSCPGTFPCLCRLKPLPGRAAAGPGHSRHLFNARSEFRLKKLNTVHDRAGVPTLKVSAGLIALITRQRFSLSLRLTHSQRGPNVCVCVCIYIGIEKYTNTHIHPSIHPSIHTSIHPYIHTSIHPYIHTYIHTFIHSYIHTFIHTYEIRTDIQHNHTSDASLTSGIMATSRRDLGMEMRC